MANDLAVYAVDLRGRGRSGGERFFVESFDDYVADVRDFVSLVKAREPGLPVYMLGHSAGGVVSCLYALEYQSGLAGLICESFAFQVPAPDFALSILKGLSHVSPARSRLEAQEQRLLTGSRGRGSHGSRSVDRRRITAHQNRRGNGPRRSEAGAIVSEASRCRCLSCTARPTRRPARAAVSCSSIRRELPTRRSALRGQLSRSTKRHRQIPRLGGHRELAQRTASSHELSRETRDDSRHPRQRGLAGPRRDRPMAWRKRREPNGGQSHRP